MKYRSGIIYKRERTMMILALPCLALLPSHLLTSRMASSKMLQSSKMSHSLSKHETNANSNRNPFRWLTDSLHHSNSTVQCVGC